MASINLNIGKKLTKTIDNQKWEDRYLTADIDTPTAPCWALKTHLDKIPLSGKALDLAAGLAGNGRFLARAGMAVESWDFSANACAVVNRWAKIYKQNIQAKAVEISVASFAEQKFDLIVVSRFLDREVFAKLPEFLKPGGVLIAQTFLAPVQPNAPQNPDFYLQSGELQKFWNQDLSCLVHGEGWLADGGEQENRYAWYVGKKHIL